MSIVSTTYLFRFKHFFRNLFTKWFDFVRKRCSINKVDFCFNPIGR